MKNKKILIVGLGLIGGSYAACLSKKGYDIYAVCHKEEDVLYAKSNGYIKDGTTAVTKEYISNFDFIIFGLYPTILISWLKEYHTYIKEGTLITDVSGVKGSIVYEIDNIIKDDNIIFVPHHPMAGREVYGVRNAKADLFKGANFIITPYKETEDIYITELKELGKELEFKNISILTPERHDEMIGFLSQLTHTIAVALMTCNDNTHLKDYTGDSFRDLTRIANINENMWSELFIMNKPALLNQMDIFIREFSNLRNTIAEDDIDKLKELMILSTERRKYFNK